MSKGPISQFIEKHYLHFNSAALVDAAKGYETHLLEGGKMMVTLAGAMSTAELGISLAEMIRQDKIQIISCTGANLEEDVINIYNTILKYYMDNNQSERFNDEIKVIEYQPFFQFYDKRIEFLYKGEVFLTIYGNNNYCVPYQKVHFKKYSVYIGTFNVSFMYLLTKFHYQYINKDKDGSYISNYVMYLLNKSKDEFLNKNKLTLLDNSIFEDFKIDCFGKTFDSTKIGNKKFIDTKRGLILPGRSRISPYDPHDEDSSFNPENYKFSNSSGNPIINPKDLIIQNNKNINNNKSSDE